MKIDVRYAAHPHDAMGYDTDTLRKHFLIDQLFAANQARLTYSHIDRIIVGGIMPTDEAVVLQAGKEMGVDYFLERREAGVINVGGSGVVVLDGMAYDLGPRDGLYIGMGVKEVRFESSSADNPAKFYLNSAPAHKSYPAVKISLADANPIRLGDAESSNVRTINQYVHPAVCESCQLVMGLTVLDPGSLWNTMPCHTHERRMEVYFYFDLNPDATVVHLMGEPTQTRHLMVANEQAVISPSWSIHSGVGTSNYAFIWGMCGENQTFDDMDHLSPAELR